MIYRFINTGVPTLGCNLRCEYCYIKQHGDEERILTIDESKSLFNYSIEHMLKALTVKRMGGVCNFHFTGEGETLLCPSLVDLMYGLLDVGHYVTLTTNTTIGYQIDKIITFPENFRKRMFFKVSFAYRELKQRQMLEIFAQNVQLLKQSGISYTIEIVSSDFLLGDIEKIKKFSIEKFGALPHVLTARNEKTKGDAYPKEISCLSEHKYNEIWGSFNSDLFNYQLYANEIAHRGKFCYAGVYTGTLSLQTGDFYACPNSNKITNLFEDIEKPILFSPIARSCTLNFCFLGFFIHILAGAEREIDTNIYFHHFRDRVCSDGSTWLTPTMREAYSHRCSEYHEPYSKEKEEFFDALMQKVYFDDEGKNDSMVNFIKAYCNRKRFEKVAMYGMGKIGTWLLPLFIKAGVEVNYAIDKRASELGDVCGMPVISPDDEPEDVDAIIVSVYSEYTAIAPLLRERTNIPIISIVDFAEDL